MRKLAALMTLDTKSLCLRIRHRLKGFPNVTVPYRSHWRIMRQVHPMIAALIEDSARGTRARDLAEFWLAELDQ